MGSVLNPVLVALVSGAGNALGNALVYLTGRGGLAFLRSFTVAKPKTNDEKPTTRWSSILKKLSFPRMREFAKKRAGWAVFILSIYPNPVLTPVIISMGATKYNFWNFMLFIWAGKTVQSLILSYLGYFGLRSLLHYFGVTLP
jgi:membrane protein DedA with SNARE-associated domain